MSATYERTFELAVPVERAWRAFTDAGELASWYAADVPVFEAKPGGALKWAGSGLEVEGTVEEVEPNHRIRWTEGPGVLPGTTEVTVTFEEAGTGTRVTITQAGFGEGTQWEGHLESHALGWAQNMQDLAMFLETGVAPKRFMTWRSDLGFGVDETPAGARVRVVEAGGFAEQVGMAPGDYVLEVAGIPVFGRAELWAVGRSRDSGERIGARFVHDGEVRTGAGTLG